MEKITMSNIKYFLKIDNKYDAEKKYRKKIQDDEKLFRASKCSHGGKRWKLLDINDGVNYNVFGFMFPTDEEQPETIDMLSELETAESTEQKNHEGQGLKISTPQQILTKLTISLAQLKVGNNSQKLKNEIRQLLYSLFRSKS